MGKKLFADGQLLTADDINTHLVNNTQALEKSISTYSSKLIEIKKTVTPITTAVTKNVGYPLPFLNGEYPIKTFTDFQDMDLTKSWYEIPCLKEGHDPDLTEYGAGFSIQLPLYSIKWGYLGVMNRGNVWKGQTVEPYPRSKTGLIGSGESYDFRRYGFHVRKWRKNETDPINLYVFAYVKEDGKRTGKLVPLDWSKKNLKLWVSGAEK